ncbi:hypothetical protein GOBAR_AA40453 [Gossypium barbadense]|uniref:Uncharacterized protein n=1 Tax=Gossypium barbadense TaxID=3634 RepID=A0A2P5VN37_GOSBA|nr:hypothetical protein GOBAR_AA40453 [Gossypium barbadense]
MSSDSFFSCPQLRIFVVEDCVLHSDKILLSATVTVKKLYLEYHEDGDSNRVSSQASASTDVYCAPLLGESIDFEEVDYRL